MQDEQKYVVFKREDFDDPESEAQAVTELLLSQLPPDSFTVIRHGDVFAAPALFAYANTIQTAIEIILRKDEQTDVSNLIELRDLFQERATYAQQEENQKVPD